MKKKLAALLAISLIATSISYPIEIGNAGQMIALAEENASEKKNSDVTGERDEKTISRTQIIEATASDSTKKNEDIDETEKSNSTEEITETKNSEGEEGSKEGNITSEETVFGKDVDKNQGSLMAEENATGSNAQKLNVINETPVPMAMTLPEALTYEVEETNITLEYIIGEDGITITGCIRNSNSSDTLEIPESIDGEDVVEIGEEAFFEEIWLRKIIIPEGVTSIGDKAFLFCGYLEEIILPDSLTNIGIRAFAYCGRLTKIILPNSLISIGDYAFESCGGITEIILPDSLTSIGMGAFESCEGITEIILPDSLTCIEAWTFAYCHRLTKIILPDSLMRIEDYAFSACASLKEIKLPDSLTSIGNSVFENCGSLIDITWPDGLTSIGSFVFEGCDSLTDITWPNTITNIEDGAFVSCSGLTKITIPNWITNIGEEAFAHCDGLTEVICPDSVITIESDAFMGCKNLTKIELPESLTYLGSAFFGCSSLTEVILPDSLTYIEGSVFHNCSSLAEITWPGLDIKESTFNNCINLRKVTISNGAELIEYSAFEGCGNLKEISLPVSITSIWDKAFFACNNLENVYYAGSPLEWDQINISLNNDCLMSANIHYNSYGKEFNKTIWNGHTYQLCSELDWETAKTYCESKGGYLASITSQEENNFLFDYISQNGVGDAYFGLTDAEKEGEWRWVNGETADYFAWADGEPNGGTEENYAMFHGSSEWNDGSGESNYFICEWDEAPEFNRYIYQANILNDLSIPNSATVDADIKSETVCEQYLVDLQNRGFDWATDLWDACDLISSSLDDPTKILEFVVEPKDIYMAIILDTLETSVDMDLVVDSEYKKMIKSQEKFVSTVIEAMKLYNIDIIGDNNYQNLSDEEKERLSGITEAFFKDETAGLDAAKQVLSGASKAMDTVSNIENYYERCVSMVMMANLSQSMKEVVEEAYKQSKGMDPYLQAAFKECVDIINSSQEEMILEMINKGGTALGWNSFKYLYKEIFWEDVSKKIKIAYPEVEIIQAAYKSGKYIADLTFNTSQITEQYGNMLGIYWVEQAFNKAYDSLQQKFLDSGSEVDAMNYLSALEVVFRGKDQDCVEAWKFVDAVDHDGAWINGLLGNEDDINNAKEEIDALQRLYYSTYESAQTTWINYLSEDYPGYGLEEIYEPLFAESQSRILAKKWVSACPVDVYVYDSEDRLVASIVGKRVFCDGDLTIALDGDVKTLCFYEGTDDYYIRYVGNGSGSMDVTVTEYQEGMESRIANFYDIPLRDGKTYEADAMASDYGLEENGNEILPDYDSSVMDKTDYSASIQSGIMIQSGEPFLTMTACAGETIDVQAYIPKGRTFIRWVASNGEDIFEDELNPITTFRMPEEDIQIYAVMDLCIIAFDSQGGSEIETIERPFNAVLGTLEEPSWDGYEFIGWYTEPEGQGSEVTVDTVVSGNMKLYAFWKQNEQENQGKVTLIVLSMPTQEIRAGENVQLNVKIYPEEALDKTVIWSTSDSTVAAVSSSGMLTAFKQGKVTVSVSLPDGSLKQSITIEILASGNIDGEESGSGSSSDGSESGSGSSTGGGSSSSGGNSSGGDNSGSGSGSESSSGNGSSSGGGSSSGSGGSSSGGGGSSSGGGSGSGGGGSVSGGASGGPGASIGIVSIDAKKGHVNSVTGIITGTGDGYSKWVQDEKGWKFLYADNSYASGYISQDQLGQSQEQIVWEWINGVWFAFGADGYLKTGFVYDYALTGWFYVDVNLGMRTGWVQVNEKWYYFHEVSDGKRGIMYMEKLTPDGYFVGKDGVWDGKTHEEIA